MRVLNRRKLLEQCFDIKIMEYISYQLELYKDKIKRFIENPFNKTFIYLINYFVVNDGQEGVCMVKTKRKIKTYNDVRILESAINRTESLAVRIKVISRTK